MSSFLSRFRDSLLFENDGGDLLFFSDSENPKYPPPPLPDAFIAEFERYETQILSIETVQLLCGIILSQLEKKVEALDAEAKSYEKTLKYTGDQDLKDYLNETKAVIERQKKKISAVKKTMEEQDRLILSSKKWIKKQKGRLHLVGSDDDDEEEDEYEDSEDAEEDECKDSKDSRRILHWFQSR